MYACPLHVFAHMHFIHGHAHLTYMRMLISLMFECPIHSRAAPFAFYVRMLFTLMCYTYSVKVNISLKS